MPFSSIPGESSATWAVRVSAEGVFESLPITSNVAATVAPINNIPIVANFQ
jgi:hypothetical protein